MVAEPRPDSRLVLIYMGVAGTYGGCRGVTDGSHMRGTVRSLQVTEGHDGSAICVQEALVGVRGTREDSLLTRFGTVRPRVQIPGPRPSLYSKSTISAVVGRRVNAAGSQFSADQRNRGGVMGLSWGHREIPGRQSVATQRPKPADAQRRTVRHRGLNLEPRSAPLNRVCAEQRPAVCVLTHSAGAPILVEGAHAECNS